MVGRGRPGLVGGGRRRPRPGGGRQPRPAPPAAGRHRPQRRRDGRHRLVGVHHPPDLEALAEHHPGRPGRRQHPPRLPRVRLPPGSRRRRHRPRLPRLHHRRPPSPPPPGSGLWTAGPAPSRAGLPSRAGAPPSGGAGSGAPGNAGMPWLVVNARSGDGKAGRVGLVEAARARGIRVHVLESGDDLVGLARTAVAEGAGAIGVAGGDGSLGLVAKVAVEGDVPFVCVPSGTRNHFAGDLGLDRSDPVAALEAFGGTERRIDVGMVGDRMFLNNVSLGAYADVVADPRYRAAKLATAHAVLPASLRGERDLLRVGLRDADGREHPDVLVLLVASNCYELDGVRERLDAGVLQVSVLRARTGAALAGLAGRALARGGRAPAGGAWAQWTTASLRVEAPVPELAAGVDGEALTLPTPLEFQVLPGALRVLVPPALAPPAPRVHLYRWSTVRRLVRAAVSSPG